MVTFSMNQTLYFFQRIAYVVSCPTPTKNLRRYLPSKPFPETNVFDGVYLNLFKSASRSAQKLRLTRNLQGHTLMHMLRFICTYGVKSFMKEDSILPKYQMTAEPEPEICMPEINKFLSAPTQSIFVMQGLNSDTLPQK